ncbi:hypothetical protein HAQ01_05155 [Acidithiobacillus thiooxidans]|uniref:hypothetical protein n=1 Tax=Acidithiobacillus thiooxidans TaxID=930 RepID=UPI001C074500|nr:hypothetical protein [Acidithiobacillus thiooxidans]MBU2792781.1 hypothetical protein [Acidithiobacillus thiooxidans]
MQSTVHYSVSMHHLPFSMTTPPPHNGRPEAQPIDLTTNNVSPDRLAGPQTATTASIQPPNGFKAMKEAARHDFFSIRADAVQDGALALLDSLAEYLVWDGMDRRLRAVASATHTDYPEAVVSVQQIAKDIKIRIGHDLCERTIERALKKLCDVGLLLATARFHQGRRQASSYQLLYTPSMASRLMNSRRGGASKDAKITTTNDTMLSTNTYSAVPKASAVSEEAREALETPYHSLTRIGDRLPMFSAPVLDDKNPLPAPLNGKETNDPTSLSSRLPEVCRSAHAELSDEPASNALKTAIPEKDERTHNQPTQMSPLFNKENKKENKKVFKNVFLISDFSKNPLEVETSPTPSVAPGTPNGYYLDKVHQKGWVSTASAALHPYLDDLSRVAFFAGHHTLDALQNWFQSQENAIAAQQTTLTEILNAVQILDSGVSAKTQETSVTHQEPARRKAIL